MAISSALAAGTGSGTASTGGALPEQSASCVVAKAATGSHTLTLDGYSRIKQANCRSWPYWITSSPFSVGGHSCAGERVQARYTFSILGQNGQPSYSASSGVVYTFTATSPCGGGGGQLVSSCVFLEPMTTACLRGDCLKVRCDVTVYKELRTEDRDVPGRLVAVPPSNMGDQLGRLLSSGVGADLVFQVAGEMFAAHRLAVRSPVLLQEIVSAGIQISGMEARVFKALLHYIYTDSLPEIDEDKTTDMARQLIAAANRYGLDRLRLICEDMLCRRVDTSTVAATLALAEQYNCHGLKKACVQFLMSGSNLKAAMAASGFERLRSSCPSVLMDLLAMVVR